MRLCVYGNRPNMKILTETILLMIIAILKDNAKASFDREFIRQPRVCVEIPLDLKLCRNVGYHRMILPNLLNHESLDEVRQQASSFVPLLSQHCHPHLQEFLCSLFAPVCLPEGSAVTGPIPPCKSLCKSVERSCTPIMKLHNFDWPAMLNCSKYKERDPCVNIVTSGSPTPTTTPRRTDGCVGLQSSCTSTPTVATRNNICAPCGTELESDTLHDNYCASEFVLKIKAKKVKTKKGKGVREIVADRKRRVIYKTGPLSKRDLRRLKLVVRGTKKCTCPPIDSKPKSRKKKRGKRNKAFYLVMGRKVGKKLLVTVIHSWPRRNKILKQANKTNFNARECPEFGNTDMS